MTPYEYVVSIKEIREYVRSKSVNLPEEFLRAFFSPDFSQKAIDSLAGHYHPFGEDGRENEERSYLYKNPYGIYRSRPTKLLVRIALWDFCRQRTPWACHPAHLAALASLIWRHNLITHSGLAQYRAFYQRDHGTVPEIAASMWPYRCSPITMLDFELTALSALEDTFDVYRGGFADDHTISRGCSWSLDKSVSESFSRYADGRLTYTDALGMGVENKYPHMPTDMHPGLHHPGIYPHIFGADGERSSFKPGGKHADKQKKPVLISKRISRDEVVILSLSHGESEVVLCPDLSEAVANNRQISDNVRNIVAERCRIYSAASKAEAEINTMIRRSVMSAFPMPIRL